MKPFNPEDRAKLLALARNVLASDSDKVISFMVPEAIELANLVRAHLEDEAGVGESAGAKVKPLEWVDRHDNPTRPNDLIASSIVGQYQIRPSADGVYFRLFIPGRPYNDAEVFNAVPLAKAAAQADYEARILSALVSPEAAQEDRT